MAKGLLLHALAERFPSARTCHHPKRLGRSLAE